LRDMKKSVSLASLANSMTGSAQKAIISPSQSGDWEATSPSCSTLRTLMEMNCGQSSSLPWKRSRLPCCHLGPVRHQQLSIVRARLSDLQLEMWLWL
jgi:hypothetical protein